MDYQALAVGVAALVTAVGTVVAGVYTARGSVKKDTYSAQILLEQAEAQTNIAIETATKGRIEALVQDANDARRRTREVEEETEERYVKAQERFLALEKLLIEQRRNSQRGWDLANYHYGLMLVIYHILNNILTVVTLDPNERPSYESLLGMTLNAKERMATVKIPKSVDSPLASSDNTA